MAGCGTPTSMWNETGKVLTFLCYVLNDFDSSDLDMFFIITSDSYYGFKYEDSDWWSTVSIGIPAKALSQIKSTYYIKLLFRGGQLEQWRAGGECGCRFLGWPLSQAIIKHPKNLHPHRPNPGSQVTGKVEANQLWAKDEVHHGQVASVS